MELAQLRSFLRVAETGSISRAADSLALTQPAVTQQMKALEAELNVKLFDRHPRGMVLTQAGELVRDHARRCLAAVEDCRLAISELETGQSGRLTIGAGVTTSIFKLPGWLRAFRSRHPKIDVAVRTGRSREITALLGDGEVDVGIVTTRYERPNLVWQPLFDEDIVLVAPGDHPLACDDAAHIPASKAGLASVPLIMFPHGTGFRAYLDAAMVQNGITPAVKMETDSVEALKRFVEAGLGASFLPLSAVEAELAAGTLAQIRLADMPQLHRTTYLAYPENRFHTFAVRKFIEMLSESEVEPPPLPN